MVDNRDSDNNARQSFFSRHVGTFLFLGLQTSPVLIEVRDDVWTTDHQPLEQTRYFLDPGFSS